MTTGWPQPALAQDESRPLFDWFASKPEARSLARERAANIRDLYMKTLYAKRVQAHQCALVGTQVSGAKTKLLRVHISGHDKARGFGPSKARWEWVCTGQAIEGGELDWLMKRYPICEFQSDDDLIWRIKRAQETEC